MNILVIEDEKRLPVLLNGDLKMTVTAQVYDLHSGLGLFQNSNDLLFGESPWFHVQSPSGVSRPKSLRLQWFSFQAEGHSFITGKLPSVLRDLTG